MDCKHLLLGHAKAYRTIHELDWDAKVGVAKNITLLQPKFKLNPLDHLMTNIQSYIFNEAFWEAAEKGEIELSMPGLETVKIEANDELKNSMDFIGVNYYTRYLVEASGKTVTRKGAEMTELGWEVYPELDLFGTQILVVFSS